jgi:energy-coupling factor transport system substrate-specific component
VHSGLSILTRSSFRIETDDISTFLVGPPDQLFPAMRDLFVAATRSESHCVLAATVSRGCPGEPEDPICTPVAGGGHGRALPDRIDATLVAVRSAPQTGQEAVAQFSVYPLGARYHMGEIYGCIDFLRQSGVFD